MKRHFLYLLLLMTTLFLVGDSRPEIFTPSDSADIGKMSSVLAKSEPRQMGLLGFTALGALMFPILVSLGMASFVSHLPTVFKEFASEFGIPATPPRNFFFFRRNLYGRSGYDSRLDYILNNLQRLQSETSGNGDILKYNYGRSRR
ncbi:uncharacterized protein LOC129958909 [Argiope bruennichi]|uniref:Uncharacterized protein n=1 Tax=Argiope bruennichi TaxID=94029 RepID=A0A8T0F280_ARGBR|nr:uncharacterized protein LOC129958909 [Argiope bruennichi]KAF8785254.1 hypothetical protein HNY73_010826 [Argiope bruennichi]